MSETLNQEEWLKKLKTSGNAWTIIETIWKWIGMDYINVARIAFAISLLKMDDSDLSDIKNLDDSIFEDTKWLEFNPQALKNVTFYRILLSCLYEEDISSTDKRLFSNQSYFKYHIDRWAPMLRNLWKLAEWDPNKFLVKIVAFIK